MNYVIIGCGRVGAQLADRLNKRGHNISIIDHIPSAFNNLPLDFLGRTIEGEALNQTVLHRAGIEKADGLVAVTNSDSLNAVVAHIARTVYKIPNIVVRNFDPRYRALHEAFKLQIISSSSWGAQRIEELLYYSDLRTVFSAGNGEVEIYEFTIPENWAGKTLNELLPAGGCTPIALTRAGQAILIDCDSIIQVNDIVLVSATFDGIHALRSRLHGIEEG
jgi:trk system potassium uptake protein TrkA